MQNKNLNQYVKIQSHDILITSTTKTTALTQIVFSFNTTILAHAKKILNITSFNLLEDLSQAGKIGITNINQKNLIIVSLGDKKQFNLEKLHKSIKALANFISNNKNVHEVDLICEDTIAKLLKLNYSTSIEQILFNLFNNLYYFDNFKQDKKSLSFSRLNLTSESNLHNAIKNTISMINGIFLIKNLGNNPANIVTPTYLANIAANMTDLSQKVKCKIFDKEELEQLGMYSFLAVSKGSEEPPKLITLHYRGSNIEQKPIVLIGKGVTFDCGGISIKPAASMNEMKYDMMGAATVLGVFQTTVELELPINLIVVAPCTENLINGRATKPGDIVTSMSGKTIEILNTDAEGRLALCDALTYVEQFEPELVIDIATLTGACIIALGHAASGLYANDDKLIQRLIKSSNNTLDKVWHMPLFDEYEEGITSSVADLANIGSWTGAGGSAVAAKFLSKFANYKWAHLDIAGVAHIKGQYDGNNANGGATGRPFSLIVDFLRNYNN